MSGGWKDLTEGPVIHREVTEQFVVEDESGVRRTFHSRFFFPAGNMAGIIAAFFLDVLRSHTESGRSAARLARLVWDQEVAGSNPAAPTSFLCQNPLKNRLFLGIFCFLAGINK